MITFIPIETLITIGSVKIATPGAFMMLGILLAYTLARKTAERRGLSVTIIDDCTIIGILMGILGARLLYIILHFPYYLEKPLTLFTIWDGGLLALGGFLGGFIGIQLYLKKKKLNFWYYADTISPYCLLAEGMASLGALFAWQDKGTKTDLPWSIIVGNDGARHPIKLYVFLILAGGFWLIREYQKRHPEKYAGYFFFLTSGLYFTQTFFIAFIADYTQEATTINQQIFIQASSIIMLLITAYCAWRQGMKEERKKRLRKGLDARTMQW